jgi:hypothetical protein
MIANNVCFQAVATVTSMADMRRKAVIHGSAYGRLLHRIAGSPFRFGFGSRSSPVREGHGIALWGSAVAVSRYQNYAKHLK